MTIQECLELWDESFRDSKPIIEAPKDEEVKLPMNFADIVDNPGIE